MFQGGLGNQLYEYAYFQFLKKKFPYANFYGFYYKKWLHDHNGLEIDKWFRVELPPTNFIIYFFSVLLYYIARALKFFRVTPSYINKNWRRDDNALFQVGFWQDANIVKTVEPLQFKELSLNAYNKTLIEKIESCESISIHVRRGDYMSPANYKLFGNICTTKYYIDSIEYIKKNFKNPVFFIFSNDIDYSRSLFHDEKNVLFVDKNQGADSFFDMYLMAHCKGMILANSSFSSWAAYLNRTSKCIIAPSKWMNFDSPNVYIDEWIKIEG